MAFDNLSEREKRVLANLVNYYISSADPVGSRAIANKFSMGISSATIRNTLQDLEELGLVEQPHTSAGRVPTDLGYRVYVDYLLKPEVLSEAEKLSIQSRILSEGRGINEILGQTAKLLGDITAQLGVTIGPRFESGRLRNIRLIPVSDDRIMVVVIVKSGLARSVLLEIEANIPLDAMPEVESVLNDRLSGLTLLEVRRTISERMADVRGEGRLINLVIDSKENIWSEEGNVALHVSGTDKLLRLPEFEDRELLGSLMKIVEDGRVLGEALAQASEEGLVITIGKENSINEIMSCSMVTSPYKIGNISGAIGIIGPTRMPYSKLVSVVQYTAKSITEFLSGVNSRKEIGNG